MSSDGDDFPSVTEFFGVTVPAKKSVAIGNDARMDMGMIETFHLSQVRNAM